MDTIAMPVTIVVKAPNQQIEDQTVHCELNWTIKKLKGHLSEVYPSKPRLEDQKLIYSGQLLLDSVQLKDVLRTYEGQENHTVHLVCSPPRDSLRSSSSKKSNVSSSNSNNSVTVNASSSTSSCPTTTTSSTNIIHANESDALLNPNNRTTTSVGPQEMWASAAAAAAYPNIGAYSGSDVANQMAWMQHAYSQYMNSYMQYLSSTQGGNVNDATRLAYQPYSGYVPGTTQFNYQHPMYNAPQQQQQQQNLAAANNQPQQQDNNDEEEGRAHRDWLDWFYVMSRVLVLFSIVYFYSSPIRFLMVSTLGMIMYLYQVGFLRMQGLEGRGEANANNRNAANAGVQPERENNNDQPDPAVAADVPPADGDGATSNSEPQNADAPVAEADRPSFLSLTWTILCSFLLSLIPEQPNVI